MKWHLALSPRFVLFAALLLPAALSAAAALAQNAPESRPLGGAPEYAEGHEEKGDVVIAIMRQDPGKPAAQMRTTFSVTHVMARVDDRKTPRKSALKFDAATVTLSAGDKQSSWDEEAMPDMLIVREGDTVSIQPVDAAVKEDWSGLLAFALGYHPAVRGCLFPAAASAPSSTWTVDAAELNRVFGLFAFHRGRQYTVDAAATALTGVCQSVENGVARILISGTIALAETGADGKAGPAVPYAASLALRMQLATRQFTAVSLQAQAQAAADAAPGAVINVDWKRR